MPLPIRTPPLAIVVLKPPDVSNPKYVFILIKFNANIRNDEEEIARIGVGSQKPLTGTRYADLGIGF